jgi:hypothetical protein
VDSDLEEPSVPSIALELKSGDSSAHTAQHDDKSCLGDNCQTWDTSKDTNEHHPNPTAVIATDPLLILHTAPHPYPAIEPQLQTLQ